MPVNPFSEQDVTHARQQVQIQSAVLQAAKAQLQTPESRYPDATTGWMPILPA